MELFNSRDKRYKSKYGAVESGTVLTFRLLLPFETGAVCYAARMFVTSEFTGETETVDFVGTGKFENGFRWWELHYRAKEPGLYWYHFEYDGPYSTEPIYRGPFGSGEITQRVNKWQLTVYERGYRTPELLKGGIMYQIFPDRFCCSGFPKAGVPADRDMVPWNAEPRWRPDEYGKVWNNDYFGGDLRGITEKLSYLRDLGVSIIYLNPIFESHTNHRYSTADYSKIDPLLGTEEDFKALCHTAHWYGIKVILDGVFNHTGDDSVYFNKKGRYPEPGAYNSKESPYYPWFKFRNWPDDYESWWDFDTLPDVDESNPDYVEYITGENGIIAKWLRLGADGWRLDVADELPDAFIEKIHERARQTKSNAIIIGEVWEDASNKISYSQRRKYLLGRELDSVMNYPFANAIIDFLADNDAEGFLDKILTVTENYPKPIVDELMNLLGTHDTERILTRLAGAPCGTHDRQWQSGQWLTPAQHIYGVLLERMAATLQYTLPGFPSLYYGDEAGMEGYKDPFNRRGMTWDNINTDLHAWYTWLGHLRRSCPLLKHGQFVPISGAQGCVAYARMDVTHPDLSAEGDAIVVIANRNGHDIDYYLPEQLGDLVPIMNVSHVDGRSVRVGAVTCAILGRGAWTLSEPMEEPDQRPDRFKDV